MPKFILVTVGISALENLRSILPHLKLEEIVAQLNQEGEDSQLYSKVKEDVLKNLTSATQRYLEGRDTGYSKLSAEIASLLAMEKAEKKDTKTGKVTSKIGKIGNEDKIVLLRSDTVDGKLCAEVTETILKSNISDRVICNNVEIKNICGLQGEDPEKFIDPGLKNLEEVIKFYKSDTMDIYLNVTGGFKGVLPYISPLARDNGMTIVYLFERSKGIIVIPPSPKPDFSAMRGVSWSSIG